MISKPFVFLLSTVLLMGCINSEKPNTLPSTIDSEPIIHETKTPEVKIIENPQYFKEETFSIGNYQIIIKQTETNITEVNYLSYNEEIKEQELLASNLNVSRQSDSLIFVLKNGEIKHLIDIPFNEEIENYNSSALYKYQKDLVPNNFWQISAIGYEYHFTVLLSKINDEKLDLIGPGVFSPSKELLFCTNIDLEAGYNPNGVELYKLQEGLYTKIGLLELEQFGLKDLEWISDSKLKAKKAQITENINYEITNVEIEIKSL